MKSRFTTCYDTDYIIEAPDNETDEPNDLVKIQKTLPDKNLNSTLHIFESPINHTNNIINKDQTKPINDLGSSYPH